LYFTMFAKTSLALLAGPVLLASAFPEIAKMVEEKRMQERQVTPQIIPFPEYPGTPNHALFNQFDPNLQLVNTSGEHEWRAPGPGDIRGPCAGLNAAANHGFIQRDGVVDAASINTGLWEAYGLDKTATIFLETATAFFNGDPISGKWSIGPHSDKTSSLPPILGDALGNETGICAYGHLRSEGDASITRGDWLAPEMNSNCRSYPVYLQALFDLANKRANGMITPRVLAEHSNMRKQQSIATNPFYFSPAYAGVAFTFGAHMFAFHLLANHSAEEPRGFLTQDVFMDFFSYKRDANGELVYKYGYERIPDNWYKRHPLDPWTLADIGISTAQQCAAYPQNCQVGGNTGTVNSFSGVNAGNITGGFLQTFEDLSDPAKTGCFIAQAVQADTPSFLSKVLGGAALQAALAAVDTRLIPSLEPLKALGGGCVGVPAGRSMFEYGINFPGANFETEGPRSGL
jgi:hypothetical protein